MHRPPRAPRKDHGPNHGPLVGIDQRNGRRVPYIGVADIGHEQEPTRGVEGEPIRTDAYGDPYHFFFPGGGENADRVLAPIRSEKEAAFVRCKDARNALQSGNGPTEAIGSGVYDLDTIVRRMGDVEPGGGVIDRSVIKPAFLRMRGKLDVAQEPEAHRGACSNLAFPSTLSLQYA